MSIVNQIDVNDSAYDIKSKNPAAEEISAVDTKGIVTTAGTSVTEQQMFDALAKQTKQYINFVEDTLTAGATAISLDCAGKSLTDNSMLDIYTNKYGVVPKTITVNADQNQIVMTFKAQSTDVKILVRIMEDKGGV